MQRLTIVLPVHDEAPVIATNVESILAGVEGIGDTEWRILAVDDGSSDDTARVLRDLAAREPRLELLALTRNFGKEAAILAGLERAGGDAVIVMDSDLQHPPQLIPRMLALWRGGARVVEAVKQDRGRESALGGLFARLFYRVFSRFSGIRIQNATDFKLLDRAVVERYCALPEKRRFFRGLVPWLGYPAAQIPFSVPERSGGSSSWSFLRLLRLALGAITSFSSLPLHIISLLGAFVFAVSLVLGAVALYDKFTGAAVSGFTTVILLLLLIGSVLMVSLGILGIYVARIYEEIKARPVYLVDENKSSPCADSPDNG